MASCSSVAEASQTPASASTAPGTTSAGSASVASTPAGGEGAELVNVLIELGFPAARAQAASRHCSSPDAALEWLLENPEVQA